MYIRQTNEKKKLISTKTEEARSWWHRLGDRGGCTSLPDYKIDIYLTSQAGKKRAFSFIFKGAHTGILRNFLVIVVFVSFSLSRKPNFHFTRRSAVLRNRDSDDAGSPEGFICIYHMSKLNRGFLVAEQRDSTGVLRKFIQLLRSFTKLLLKFARVL